MHQGGCSGVKLSLKAVCCLESFSCIASASLHRVQGGDSLVDLGEWMHGKLQSQGGHKIIETSAAPQTAQEALQQGTFVHAWQE